MPHVSITRFTHINLFLPPQSPFGEVLSGGLAEAGHRAHVLEGLVPADARGISTQHPHALSPPTPKVAAAHCASCVRLHFPLTAAPTIRSPGPRGSRSGLVGMRSPFCDCTGPGGGQMALNDTVPVPSGIVI